MLSLNLPYDKDFAVNNDSQGEYTDEEFSKAMSQATANGVAVGERFGFAEWVSVFK